MVMELLWAPWRSAYVAAAKPPQPDDPCFLCQGWSENDDRKNLIVLRTSLSMVVLNRFPYNNGHLLIAPRIHKGRLEELTADEILDSQQTLRHMVEVLKRLLHPEGFNIGLNLGVAAGAGLPGHLHWHVVPRWNGDTNFMPVINEAKVIVQALDALFDLLVEPSCRTADP
jgi:ATP adenylyltransferase